MTNPTPHGQVPEALRLAQELDAVPETGADPQTIQEAAAELRRLHAENETLRTGYEAARLEIESLQARIKTMAEEHADELMVAHLDGRMRAAQPDLNLHCKSTQKRLATLWGFVPAPQQEAQEPCPTCIALARTVMLDQVSFDRKPDCYGIRQITDDEGVEEWEDIRTSPDVAREEANDMMATGRGEIYEVVPLWTTPQPTHAQAGVVPLSAEQYNILVEDLSEWSRHVEVDTAPRSLEEHIHQVFAIHGIKGGQHGAE